MIQQFETADDIDREYGRRIELEPDAGRKADLRVEAAEAKIALKERADNQRMRNAWHKLALMEYPHAAKFPELVVGNTEEEMRESAKVAHERVQEMMRGVGTGEEAMDVMRQRAQDIYGPGPSTGSSGAAPMGFTPPNMQQERWNAGFAERFNNAPRDSYGQRLGISPQEITQYTNNRFITHVKDRLRFWANMTRSDASRRNW